MDIENVVYMYNRVLFHIEEEILPHVTTWMNLEDIMLSEISQTEKHKHCMWNYKHLKVIFFFKI